MSFAAVELIFSPFPGQGNLNVKPCLGFFLSAQALGTFALFSTCWDPGLGEENVVGRRQGRTPWKWRVDSPALDFSRRYV